jgi:hypothetical protein
VPLISTTAASIPSTDVPLINPITFIEIALPTAKNKPLIRNPPLPLQGGE